MKTKQQKSSQPNECPYLYRKECGRPDKLSNIKCNSDLFGFCVSYKFLEETKTLFNMEDEKDGEQDS